MAGAELEPIRDDRVIETILRAAEDLDLNTFQNVSIGDDIATLSTNTVLDGVEIQPDHIFKTSEGCFEASATVLVTLEYGGSRDSVSIPDSYPAVVRGTYGGSEAEITEIVVDTGSFYED